MSITNDMSVDSVSYDNTFYDRTILIGLFLGSMAYGIHLTLFIWCMRLLVKKEKTRLDCFFLVYVLLLFIMGNVGNAMIVKVAEVIWVDKRDLPVGGPVAFFAAGGGPYNLTGTVTFMINSWFHDGMLLWRFWMFFVRQGRWSFAVIPGLMLVSIVGLSLLLIIKLCSPGISLWSTVSIDLAIPYWSISIALNIILTACIVARLLSIRYRVHQLMPGCSCIEYISITSMLVESAALYTGIGLIFLVSYAIKSPIQDLALPTLGQVQCIAPLLIILRVLQGRAWSSSIENLGCESDLRFNSTISTVRAFSYGDITYMPRSKVETVQPVEPVDKIVDMIYHLDTQRQQFNARV